MTPGEEITVNAFVADYQLQSVQLFFKK